MKSDQLCKCGCGQKTNLFTRGPKKGQPHDYLGGHGYPTKPGYRVDEKTGCWVWQKNLRNGYGRVWREGKIRTAHVWYWEKENGPKPEGLDLDHLCRNRACVNPAHLQAVPRTVNVRRGAQTKLTQAQVDEIRAATPYWGYLRDLAEKHGVARITIAKLRNRSYWPD